MAKKISDLQETFNVEANDIMMVDKYENGQLHSKKFKLLNIFSKLKTIFGMSLIGSGDIDAPKDGKLYGRKDGDWKEVDGGSASMNVGETPVINSENGSLFYNDNGDLGEVKGVKYDPIKKMITSDDMNAGLFSGKTSVWDSPPMPFFGIAAEHIGGGRYSNGVFDVGEGYIGYVGYESSTSSHHMVFGGESDGILLDSSSAIQLDAVENVELRSKSESVHITAEKGYVTMRHGVGKGVQIFGNDQQSGIPFLIANEKSYPEFRSSFGTVPPWKISLKPQSASEQRLDYNDLADVVTALKKIGLLTD